MARTPLRWRRVQRRLLVSALAFAGAGAAAQNAPSPYSDSAHDALIASARGGDPAGALPQLKAWLGQSLKPAQRLRVEADTIALAAQAGQPRLAVQEARTADLRALPDYALDAGYDAARAVPDTELEGMVVQALLRRHRDFDTVLKETYWFIDSGDYGTAHAVLSVLEHDTDNGAPRRRVQLFKARAVLELARHNRREAQDAYVQALEIDPLDVEARRATVFMIAEDGAPARALGEAEAANARAPDAGKPVFSAEEMAALRQQSTGEQIRWAVRERDELPVPDRFKPLDQTLAQLDAQLAALGQRQDPTAVSLRHRLQFDRLVALNERGRYAETTALYEQLLQQGVTVPYYGEAAAANAYAQQRKADLAIPVYETALRDGGSNIPIPSDVHVGLVYAYLDCGRFEDADALVTKMERATPPSLRQAPEAGRANPDYGDVAGLRALVQLYSDRDRDSQRDFERLADLAPFSGPFRTGQARMEGLRDHPYASLGRFEETLTDHPDSADAQAGYANALFDAGRIREGMALSAQLQQDYPEHPAVRDVLRYRDSLQGPSFTAEAQAGGGNSTVSDYDWSTTMRYNSQLFDNQWRLFGEQFLGFGDTDIGTRFRARTGVGGSWERNGWNAELQVTEASFGPHQTGAAGAVDWRPSDHWKFNAGFDTDSNDVPWKAWISGVAAREYNAGATYIVNESRDFELNGQRMDYSDGNSRNAAGLTWRERWISQPHSQFETWLSGDWAGGQRQNVAYYNPGSETTAQLAARYQWLTWKRDDRTFSQRIYGAIGGYDEAGYGMLPEWDLRYEQVWSFRYAFDLNYGVGRLSHPYDGEQERRWYGFLGVTVPFR